MNWICLNSNLFAVTSHTIDVQISNLRCCVVLAQALFGGDDGGDRLTPTIPSPPYAINRSLHCNRPADVQLRVLGAGPEPSIDVCVGVMTQTVFKANKRHIICYYKLSILATMCAGHNNNCKMWHKSAISKSLQVNECKWLWWIQWIHCIWLSLCVCVCVSHKMVCPPLSPCLFSPLEPMSIDLSPTVRAHSINPCLPFHSWIEMSWPGPLCGPLWLLFV